MTALSFKPEVPPLEVKSHGFYSPKNMDKAVLGAVRAGMSFGMLKRVFLNFWKFTHDDTPVDINYHGVKLRLYPQNNTIESKILLTSKKREKQELEALRTQICDGGVFVDIGANVGYYSIMASYLGASRTVSIEPNPTVYKRLLENVVLNGFEDKVRLYSMGVGENVSQEVLTVSDGDLGGSSVCNGNLSGEKQSIQIVPLTDILKQEDITKIDALKIDVEGMEDQALFPYFKSIKKSKYPKMIIIEDNKDFWSEDILSWLLENGYIVHEETRSNLILKLIS